MNIVLRQGMPPIANTLARKLYPSQQLKASFGKLFKRFYIMYSVV